MTPPEHEPAGLPVGATAIPSSLIETTLHEARITVLHPRRIVLMGDGQRLRIDHRGVSRQPLSDLRLALPMPPEATADEELQAVLAAWAGRGVPLHAHETVHSGDGFARTLHLTDGEGTRALLRQGSGQPA